MKTPFALALVVSLVACGGSSGDDEDEDDQRTFDQCDGDAQSFVRSASLALNGRRPRSSAEVKMYVDMYDATVKAMGDPNDVVARALMANPAFAERWVDVIMDALHVQRLDIQSEQGCWDEALRGTITPTLAMGVRDKAATSSADGATWTMIDLARSAIALDDLTPIYRAQLFSLASHPLPAANVPAIEAELARREDFGNTFDTSFLHRDTVCLGCHNSDGAVTDSDDPDHDRHWPVPGSAEKAIYGASMGVTAERAHAVFRVDDFVDVGTQRPWGWTTACGRFAGPTVPDDPAGVDGKLGNMVGKRTTIYDLEASLARGFASLRANGAPTGPIADPDVALAWLVTLKITEDVWKQAIGTPLTIANYFPRNEAASQQLYTLASTFVTSGFSLKSLLVAIVSSDYFNRQTPEDGCGPSAYTYPAVFDPWVTADADTERRKNGPGDAVTALDARTLVSATNAALEWGPPPMATRFPDYGERGCENASCASLMQACNTGQCCTSAMACRTNGLVPSVEVPFQRAVGMFLRNSERGFRGLDFQARLAWEDRYGGCKKPLWVTSDFIDRLVGSAAANPGAKVKDVIAALKDRLIGEPTIDLEGAEGAALVAIVGPLDAAANTVGVEAVRRVCGALIESPQFLLQGIAGRGGEPPLLTPMRAPYEPPAFTPVQVIEKRVGMPDLRRQMAEGASAM